MIQEVNLNNFTGLERESILKVLYRDQELRETEAKRIRRLKSELQQLRKKGVVDLSAEYKEKSCARCQKALGLLINSGAVCKGCSHRVCAQCRVIVHPRLWKCTVCHAHGEVKVKSGEWFLLERAKKFPDEEGDFESVGTMLLLSYQKMSKISIVPPTPPPFIDDMSVGTSKGIRELQGFTRSVENLFLSFTSNMKKISKSQNDVMASVSKKHLTTDYGQDVLEPRKERRSQSDTAINFPVKFIKAPSLPDIARAEKRRALEDGDAATHSDEDNVRSKTLYSKHRKPSSAYSLSSTCTEASYCEDTSITGEVELAVAYNFKSCTLDINIRACKNIGNTDEKKKKYNLYVKTYLLPDRSPHGKLKTTVKKNSVDPVFNETLKYSIDRSQLETRILQVSVWHSGALTRKLFLGEVLIPFETWCFEENSTQTFKWYKLKAKPDENGDCLAQYSGELQVKAKFVLYTQEQKPQSGNEGSSGRRKSLVESGQLIVIVVGAKNLSSVRSDGTTTTFVKGCLTLPNNRELKQRSPTVKKQTDPQWKHQFVFDNIPRPELQRSCLELTVWDQGSLGLTDRFLGGVRLCTSKMPLDVSSTETSYSTFVWNQLLDQTNTWIDFSVILLPNMDPSNV
ncbi:synaptotagmin-like protein 3 [Protopterus annectens]|uniref:synaptotagmin-like protein 3 n=1 Tax=Protopterus annectens TaxID=7888 RepID=UPI001CFADF49|nr:synaptotagmin-like protein 3 [Protopterus annectens]XP_043917927.1 synaptotagmin-like protein 3 [Protopterus annectens]XP_043917935.1 synaptotagmin-like protein 3 [Protopterus annectens]XP_043917945.1 synaptotagmin-like protein 3 [Protopterus annectens]XP_043917953.1 synaptotagmin-like protein 3 [Protopterus annectens]XP_043917961.1 synaptotagmin-like protein 3 [Protopterus annectens]